MTAEASNVDPSEVDKFAELAARWWDPTGDMAMLHRINPVRLRYVSDRVNLEGRKALDVGCGAGLLTEQLAGPCSQVTGMDMAEASLKVARLHLAESGIDNVEYKLSTAEELAAAQAGEYDCVVCMEVLEHVPDPESLVRACAELARPGGDVFFSTINRNPKSFLLAIVAAEYVLGLLPRGTHEYARLIKPSELRRWASAGDLELQDIAGINLDHSSQEFVLDSDVDVNYLMHFRRPE